MYKFVSDIYYSRNTETDAWDIPTIEWEFEDGGRWRERFDSEEARDAALKANYEYNESAEVKAQIEYDELHSAIFYATLETEETLEHALMAFIKVDADVIIADFYNPRPEAIARIHELVNAHNEKIDKAQSQPPIATFSLSEIFNNFQIAI
jgi:hypothetical protein